MKEQKEGQLSSACSEQRDTWRTAYLFTYISSTYEGSYSVLDTAGGEASNIGHILARVKLPSSGISGGTREEDKWIM